jgi:hypothetical protein
MERQRIFNGRDVGESDFPLQRSCPHLALTTERQNERMSSASANSGLQMPQPPIAILRSGLGGLTLGHCLRQKGIPSVIYDRAPSTPRHTYGVTLEPCAYKPLLSIHNIDELTFRKHVAVGNLNQDGVGPVSAGDSKSPTAFRANRNKLESMLKEGQIIQLEHSLSSATISDDDGSVEMLFQNGSKLRSGSGSGRGRCSLPDPKITASRRPARGPTFRCLQQQEIREGRPFHIHLCSRV